MIEIDATDKIPINAIKDFLRIRQWFILQEKIFMIIKQIFYFSHYNN